MIIFCESYTDTKPIDFSAAHTKYTVRCPKESYAIACHSFLFCVCLFIFRSKVHIHSRITIIERFTFASVARKCDLILDTPTTVHSEFFVIFLEVIFAYLSLRILRRSRFLLEA